MKSKIITEKLNIGKNDYALIKKGLKREPNPLELFLFSALWSEHCGYRHSKKYLKNLYQKNVIFKGENAGGIQIGNTAVLFKTESHNHPCAVEPFNGAATGIGGIVRDVLAMNARPIILANSLKFGDLKSKNSKYIFEKVVEGISYYGNCIGVPNITGETDFDKNFNENPLVNVFCLGVQNINKVITSKINLSSNIVLIGSATRKDGVGGASFASDKLKNNSEKKIHIQIADAFTKKKLIEATLEIFKNHYATSCQDCGAAGILSSTAEMAFKSNLGMELNLNAIHLGDKKLEPFEIMLSETQERMMFAVENNNLNNIEKICEKYELEFSIIGKAIKNPDYILKKNDEIVANIPVKLLCDAPFIFIEPKFVSSSIKKNEINTFQKILHDINFTSKEWVFSQYDYTVGTRTAVLPSQKGISAVYLPEEDCYLGLCVNSSRRIKEKGALRAIDICLNEASNKLIASGFYPIALTNCLNFANADKSEIMNDFVEIIHALNFSAKKLKTPIVSGNISFYNETENSCIPSTATIFMLGICKNKKNIKRNYFNENEKIYYFNPKSSKILLNIDEINACISVDKFGTFSSLFKGLIKNNLGFSHQNKQFQISTKDFEGFLISADKKIKNTIFIGITTKNDEIEINNEVFNKKLEFENFKTNLEKNL